MALAVAASISSFMARLRWAKDQGFLLCLPAL
jgi:hypothetical protein